MTTEIKPIDFTKIYSNEEFENMPEFDEPYELIEGKIIKRVPCDTHGRIARRISNHLFMFDPDEQIGTAWLATTFNMGQGWMPIPDLGFMIASHVPEESEKSIKGVPDLLVEVDSPSDLDSKPGRDAASNKIKKYQEFGVRIIWAISPRTKTVEIYHPGQAEPVKRLNIDDKLEGEDVFPGFELSVKAIFG